MSKTLENTQLSFAYSIFLAKNDVSLIQNFVWIISAAILWTIWNNSNGRTFAYGKGLKDEKVKDSKQKDVKFWNYPISSKITWRYAFLPTIIVPWIVILLTPSLYLFHWNNALALVIYYGHYFNRTIIYPSKISPKATPNPAWFFVTCFIATISHTFIQVHYLANLHQPTDPSIVTIIAFGISMAGAVINYHHDKLLTQLRSKNKNNDNANLSKEERYKIPVGCLFEFISCPNYFGEILEWFGFALMTSFGTPQLMFALFSTIFLGLRARFTHSWYKSNFGNKYPSERKALIPFIF